MTTQKSIKKQSKKTVPKTSLQSEKTAEKPKTKNRLTPIKSTMETVRGFPTSLVIYKSAASRFYWVRCYFNGKYKVKSTKSTSSKDAKQFAIEFYKETLLNPTTTHSDTLNKKFAVIGNQFFNATANNSNPGTYKSDFNRYSRHIIKEFNQQDIDTITNAQISNFVQKLYATGIKHATVKHHLVVLRKIMKFALANDLMKNLPVFPRITGQLQTSLRRDYLTPDEYDLLCATAEKLANKKTVYKGSLITLEMKYLIQFMVNSFIRPSDLRVLKHKHISEKTEDGETWLELNHPATKTNANPVQAMPVSVHIYKRHVELLKKSKRPRTLNDYVFFPEIKEEDRDLVMYEVGKLFKRIVQETGIQVKTDKKITLYSLRHTAIMFRLTLGQVDSLAIARNARTSQAMIDKFYASHLTTSQVRKQLHAFVK